MVHNDHQADGRSGIDRRKFVRAAGATGVAAGLAGCVSGLGGDDDGGDGGGDGSRTVQFAADQRMNENADAVKDILHEYGGLSEDIEVDVLAGSQVTDNRQDQYNQWLQANRDQPSLLLMDSGWTIPFIARNQIANLEEELSDDLISTVKDEYFEASVATATGEDDSLHGVPLFPDFPTMQYNKEYLREAGYDDTDFEKWATESMSWQEFSQIAAEALEANSDVDYGFTFQADVYEGLSCCDFNEFMTSWGGAYFGDPSENLFGPVGDRPITVDEDPVLDSIRMVRSFIYGSDEEGTLDDYEGPISPEAVLQWVEDTSLEPFSNGNAVFHRNWPYAIVANGEEDAMGEDLGVMPIPYGVTEEEAEYPMTGGPAAALGGWHVTLNPNAANKDAALQVIEAFTKPEVQLEIFGLMGWIPPRPDLLDSDEARDVDVIGRYVEQLKVAGENAIPRPVTVAWPQQSERIAQQANAAYTGDKSPEDAMSDLKQQLQDIEESSA